MHASPHCVKLLYTRGIAGYSTAVPAVGLRPWDDQDDADLLDLCRDAALGGISDFKRPLSQPRATRFESPWRYSFTPAVSTLFVRDLRDFATEERARDDLQPIAVDGIDGPDRRLVAAAPRAARRPGRRRSGTEPRHSEPTARRPTETSPRRGLLARPATKPETQLRAGLA